MNFINHVNYLIDGSLSMYDHRREVVKVVDGLTAYTARRSKELNQETRITVYVFNTGVKCLFWDMDALRMPSIENQYSPNGGTALIDATMQAYNDMDTIPQKYGDHAFLTYLLTDGEENSSRTYRSPDLIGRLARLANNHTIGILVPHTGARQEAKRWGFPTGNIELWDPNRQGGVSDAGATIQASMDTFMVNRAAGVRSTKNLFSTDANAVNAATIQAAGLAPLDASKYVLVPVAKDGPINEFVRDCGLTYRVGNGYYQMTKRVRIQPQKKIAIREKKTDKVYTGAQARQLINLPDEIVSVKPDPNSAYDVFVQSTAPNRKLLVGTHLLYML